MFATVTFMYVASNLAMGTYRLLLLQHASVDEYVIYSRVVSWSLGALMFLIVAWLLRRATRATTGGDHTAGPNRIAPG